MTRQYKPELAKGMALVSGERGDWIRGPNAVVPLTGPLTRKFTIPLLPLLDGTRTVAEISRLLGKRSEALILHVLRELEQAGALEPRARGRFTRKPNGKPVVVFDTGVLGPEPLKGSRSLPGARVIRHVFGGRGRSKSLWESVLSEDEPAVSRAVGGSSLVILSAHVRPRPLVLFFNKICMKLSIPLFAAWVESSRGFFRTAHPFQNACFECSHQWRLRNLPGYDNLMEMDKATGVGTWKMLEPDPETKYTMEALIWLEAGKILRSPPTSPTSKGELEIDFRSMKTVIRPVVKLSRCPSCSLFSRSVPENRTSPIAARWRYDRASGRFLTS